MSAPACKWCRWLLQQRRASSWLLFFMLVGIGIWFVLPLIDQIDPRWLRKLTFFGMLVVCAIPTILTEIFIPQSFDISVFEDSVDYEFRDPEYAYEFAELNEDADWVKIS